MEETHHIGLGKRFVPPWIGSKRRIFRITLLLSICIWVFLQMADSYNYRSTNADELSLQDFGKMSRKLLSRQWVFEDQTNEPWDIMAPKLPETKEDGGGVGDDEVDCDDEQEEEEAEDGEEEADDGEDVERMVKLAQQAAISGDDQFLPEFTEVEIHTTFDDVTGIPPGRLYDDDDDDHSNANMINASEDGGNRGGRISPELEEFFEVEII